MAAAAAKGGSVMGLVVPLVILTLLAGGGGALVGKQIVDAARSAAEAPDKKDEPTRPKVAAASSVTMKELAPVVTNLASPDGSWVRLQAAILFDKSDPQPIDVTAAKIEEDILAYVKTLTITQLQGATGLEQLREDLNERAVMRSEGRVRELVIEMLVIQ